MTPESWAFLKQLIETLQALGLAWLVYKTAMLTRTMTTLEKNTNSKMDALLTVTQDASHAEGVKDEKDRQQSITAAVEEAKKIAP